MTTYRYILVSLALSIAFLVIAFVIVTYWLPQLSFVSMASAIGVSLVTGIAAYALANYGLKKRVNQFISSILSAMTVKMLLGILAVVFVAITFPAVVKEYVIMYFFCYFVFTSFEVLGLMRNLGGDFKEPERKAKTHA